jgi:molecular chaperone DnaK
VRNTADSLVFQTEKLLKEQGEKVSADERTKIEDALKSLKDALAGVDIEAVKAAHEVLITASQEFAQRIYAAAQSTSADDAPGAAGSAPSDDEVADAEIVDDEKSA